MDQSNQALEKSGRSADGISESLRNTTCDQPLAKDTIADLPKRIIADESARLLSPTYPNQISKELCRLHEACWTVLREPLHAAMTFRLALCTIETVCHLEGGNGAYLLTLGMAQYRVGLYEGAVTTLAQADRLIPNTPAGLAFQAMAHYQLGALTQARTLLGRLEQVLQHPPWLKNAEADSFLREARTLIAPAKSGK
jgi:tetratricopeptide (TPR) repeat protein